MTIFETISLRLRPVSLRYLLPFYLLASTPGYALFLDGDGHYALRGETRTNPAFSKESGTYQAIEQSFRLKGEARFNDLSSMFLEFRLFDNPREAYLGDRARPNDCAQRSDKTGDDTDGTSIYENASDCAGRHQNTGEPRYSPYTPKVTEAYVRYAFDYCILEAGRRSRNWGLGILLDDGKKPFSTDASVFDGATCNVNIQKSQTLGFSVGYDKLAETGTYANSYTTDAADPTESEFDREDRRFGANDTGDDIDQYFFTIEYDDRKANAGAAFTKQVGVYFAQVNSKDLSHGGSNTDLKFLDLYTGFFFGDLAFRNELLFRMGKSADPNWVGLGGKRYDYEANQPVTNKLQSIALAGNLEWTMARSGAAVGPVEYNKGDASRHVLTFGYALAPGDKDGYRTDRSSADTGVKDLGYNEEGRDDKITAIAFHRNFKPAMLLFNARPEADKLRVDGAFDPSRVLNANVFSLGYMYESIQIGSFEVKVVTATLDEGVPGEVVDYYDSLDDKAEAAGQDPVEKPVGYAGKSLGYELDLSYVYKVGREVELGLASAIAVPGEAWKISDSNPTNEFMIQSYAAFKF
jgi:hypothetical protein